MYEDVFRRRTRQVNRGKVFRILNSEIRISTNCPSIEDSLRYLVQNARHEFPLDHRLSYVVQENGGRYSIREGRRVLATKMPMDSVLTCLFERIQERTLDAMPGWVRIHAGCGSRRGKRFLVVGAKYAGKSTLMARLLFGGLEVFGDELVLLRGGVVVPVPRKFYVREASLALLPGLAEIASRLPFARNATDGRIVAFDPQEAGFDWRITAAPVDAVFSLVPNHGRPTRLETCPKYRMAQHVMRQCNAPMQRDRNWVGDLCAMLDRAETYELHIGDLEQALHAVTGALDRQDQ